MIGLVLGIYSDLLSHYKTKWHHDRIDKRYQEWEEGQELRQDMGFDDKTVQKIPKRRIKNNGARKKHGY